MPNSKSMKFGEKNVFRKDSGVNYSEPVNQVFQIKEIIHYISFAPIFFFIKSFKKSLRTNTH